MPEAFEEFAAAETPRLLRVAYGLTGNPHDAWDLVQEALMRVGLRWRRLADGNPGGYAHTTLVRLNIDKARRSRREQLAAELPEPSGASGLSGLPGRDTPVHLTNELDPLLVAALRRLPPQQRAAVVLRSVGDLDHAGIAERLGCSVGTARTHLSRGLARLRELVDEKEVRGDA